MLFRCCYLHDLQFHLLPCGVGCGDFAVCDGDVVCEAVQNIQVVV